MHAAFDWKLELLDSDGVGHCRLLQRSVGREGDEAWAPQTGSLSFATEEAIAELLQDSRQVDASHDAWLAGLAEPDRSAAWQVHVEARRKLGRRLRRLLPEEVRERLYGWLRTPISTTCCAAADRLRHDPPRSMVW